MTRSGQTEGVSFVVTVGEGDTLNNGGDNGVRVEELSVLPVSAHVTAYIGIF